MTFSDHQTFYESEKLFTQTSSNTPGLGSSKLARLNRWLHHWSNVRPRLFTLSPSRWNVLYRVRIYDALSSHGVLASFTRARSIRRYGIGCLFVPSFTFIQGRFCTRLGFAVGLAATIN
jgi:hypothetical protein